MFILLFTSILLADPHYNSESEVEQHQALPSANSRSNLSDMIDILEKSGQLNEAEAKSYKDVVKPQKAEKTSFAAKKVHLLDSTKEQEATNLETKYKPKRGGRR